MAVRKKSEEPKSPKVVATYETEIAYDCPVRGKVKQKVKVKRLESAEQAASEEMIHSKTLADELDRKYSGLLIPDDTLDEEAAPEEEV